MQPYITQSPSSQSQPSNHLSMSMTDDHPDHTLGTAATSTRRGFLKGTAALSAGAGLALLSPQAMARQPLPSGQLEPVSPVASAGSAPGRAKNLIFMVSDGMSHGTMTLADIWLRRNRAECASRGGPWAQFLARPGTACALQRTQSANSLVTDSAAAGSAWGCGEHLNNGVINVRIDGTQVVPFFIQAQQAGKRTGCVTTTRITHATPASFYANSPRRDYEGLIATNLMQRNVDVALGGGSRFFPPSLLDKHPEVHVARTKAELVAAPSSGRLLGLFHDDHVPYVLDRSQEIPSLVDMTAAALMRLQAGPEGFVLQVEAGRVDHAAHNNDAAALLREQLEFEDCIEHVLNWVGKRDDTLVIITTDHGNANPGLALYGQDAESGLQALGRIKHSFDWIYDQIAPIRNAQQRIERLPGLVQEATGIQLTDRDRKHLVDVMNDQPVMPFSNSNTWTSVLGAILAQYTAVSFMSRNHSSDHVMLSASGPGASTVRGVMDNINIHALAVSALGLPKAEPLADQREPLKMPAPPKPD